MTVISSLKNTSLYFIVGTAVLLSSSPIANPNNPLYTPSFTYAALPPGGSDDSADEGLIETHPCMEFDRADVASSADKTVGTCSTNECDGGCCRYHTSFLTCDQDNDYWRQPCVCNDITNNTHIEDKTGGGDSDGDGIDVGQNSTYPPVIGGDDGNQTSIECSDGNVWWNTLDLEKLNYTTCSTAAACENVTEAGGATYEKTCCLKQFCWCGNSNNEEDDCL